MPRRTPTTELLSEENVANSPLRRSSRNTSTTESTKTGIGDVVNSPARVTRSRRMSQDDDKTVEKAAPRTRKVLQQLDDEQQQQSTASPGRPRRRASISSENNDVTEPKTPKTRSRRLSQSDDKETPTTKSRARSSTATDNTEAEKPKRTRRASSEDINDMGRTRPTRARRNSSASEADDSEVEFRTGSAKGRRASSEEPVTTTSRSTRGRRSSFADTMEPIKEIEHEEVAAGVSTSKESQRKTTRKGTIETTGLEPIEEIETQKRKSISKQDTTLSEEVTVNNDTKVSSPTEQNDLVKKNDTPNNEQVLNESVQENVSDNILPEEQATKAIEVAETESTDSKDIPIVSHDQEEETKEPEKTDSEKIPTVSEDQEQVPMARQQEKTPERSSAAEAENLSPSKTLIVSLQNIDPSPCASPPPEEESSKVAVVMLERFPPSATPENASSLICDEALNTSDSSKEIDQPVTSVAGGESFFEEPMEVDEYSILETTSRNKTLNESTVSKTQVKESASDNLSESIKRLESADTSCRDDSKVGDYVFNIPSEDEPDLKSPSEHSTSKRPIEEDNGAKEFVSPSKKAKTATPIKNDEVIIQSKPVDDETDLSSKKSTKMPEEDASPSRRVTRLSIRKSFSPVGKSKTTDSPEHAKIDFDNTNQLPDNILEKSEELSKTTEEELKPISEDGKSISETERSSPNPTNDIQNPSDEVNMSLTDNTNESVVDSEISISANNDVSMSEDHLPSNVNETSVSNEISIPKDVLPSEDGKAATIPGSESKRSVSSEVVYKPTIVESEVTLSNAGHEAKQSPKHAEIDFTHTISSQEKSEGQERDSKESDPVQVEESHGSSAESKVNDTPEKQQSVGQVDSVESFETMLRKELSNQPKVDLTNLMMGKVDTNVSDEKLDSGKDLSDNMDTTNDAAVVEAVDDSKLQPADKTSSKSEEQQISESSELEEKQEKEHTKTSDSVAPTAEAIDNTEQEPVDISLTKSDISESSTFEGKTVEAIEDTQPDDKPRSDLEIPETSTIEEKQEKKTPKKMAKPSDSVSSTDEHSGSTTESASSPEMKKVKYVLSKSSTPQSVTETLIKTKLREFEEADDDDDESGSEKGSDLDDPRRFLDDMAEEVEEEETQVSEDSNEIVDEGESVGFSSDDSDRGNDEYENDSFLCDDEEQELLSGNDDFDIEEDKKRERKKKKVGSGAKSKYSRIIAVDDNESEDSEENKQTIENDKPKSKYSRIKQKDSSSDNTGDEDSEYKNGQESAEVKPKSKYSRIKPTAAEDSSSGSTDYDDLPLLEAINSNNSVTIEDAVMEEITADTRVASSNRRSSLSIQENLNINSLKETPLGKRINKLVESFCNTISTTGDIQLNLSLEFEEAKQPKKSDETAKNIEVLSDEVINLDEDQPSGKEASEESRLYISLDEEQVEPAKKEKKQKIKRRLSKSLEIVETPPKLSSSKKAKRKHTEIVETITVDDDEDVIPKKKAKKKTPRKKESTIEPLASNLRTNTFNLMSQLVTDVKNRERRQILPSVETDNSWIETVAVVKPSKTNVATPKLTPTTKLHPKDFKNRMLNDRSRVRRVDAKKILKHKLRN